MVNWNGVAMTSAEISSAVASLLLESGAIHVSGDQPFILAAGWASPVYVDARLLFGNHKYRQRLVEIAVDYVNANVPVTAFDTIVGADTAGIPIASLLADRLGRPFRYVRKRPLGIGRNAQVEGGAVDGHKVLLVDDLTTDGGSKLNFVRGLRAAGAVVEHILTVFYHDVFPGANDRLQKAGLRLHALATWSDLLGELEGSLSPSDKAKIRKFLEDPLEWSKIHGGWTPLLSRQKVARN